MTAAPRPLERIAGFAAMLRDHGFVVGVPEQQAMVRAALELPIEQHARLDPAWRSIACHDVRDWRRWPDLFARYWHSEAVKGSTRISGDARPRRSLEQVVHELQQQTGAESPVAHRREAADTALQDGTIDGAQGELRRAQGGASRTEALHDRSLTQWLPQDLALLEQIAERIAKSLQKRLARRWHHLPTGRRLDLRHTLRRSLATAGVPVFPAWKIQRRERRKLFILVDVSRSMEMHAQLFLRIARAFVKTMNARVFVFHTRLAEVTPLLRSDSAAVQEKVNAVTAGFGGGTRIATSLADFRTVHARAQLGRGSRVWVLSDGFDADEPEALREQLALVQRCGAQVTWFYPSMNPPASRAMQAAMSEPRLVHELHRLNSLRDLALLAAQLH
jgi:uncharacterized protein with von Willebrand factor type A (vWA) domain